MTRFLLLKTSAIGDVIQTFPVVDYLRKKFPDCQIDWIVEKPAFDLVAACPDIHQAYCIDTKKWKREWRSWREIKALRAQLAQVTYDAVFDLQGNTKSALLSLLVKAKDRVGFGFHSVKERTNLLSTNKRFEIPRGINVRLQYLQLVQTYFGDPLVESEEMVGKYRDLKKIMVAFGSNWPNKQIKLETLKQFLGLIDKEFGPTFYFVWGSEKEGAIAEELHALFPSSQLVPRLSLPAWQALMREMDYVIALDSAALHLCGTTNTPSFSYFGPTLATIFKPLGAHHTFFQGSCPYGVVFDKQCPQLRTCKTGACLSDIPAETLFHSFLNAIGPAE